MSCVGAFDSGNQVWEIVKGLTAGPVNEGEAQGSVRSLMTAILFDALQSCICFADSKSVDGKRRYQEALDWVGSPQNDYIFSYESICSSLGFDANWIRTGLSRLLCQDEEEKIKIRRRF